MNRRHPRSSGIASRVPWLGAGLSFILGITGWASETPPDEASALFGTTELSVHIESTGGTAGQAGLPSELYGEVDAAPASGEQTTDFEGGGLQPSTPTDEFLRSRIALSEAEPSGHAGLKRDEKAAPPVRNRPAADNPDEQLQLLIAESRSQVRRAGIELAEAGYYGPSEMEDEHANPSGGAASNVEVRVGDHGAYERVVFEWPEGIDYDVAQRGEQVSVAFSRPGRIDLSWLRDGFGQQVVEAWAAGGEVTDHVVLRVVPDARIRTFTLEDDRIVAIDVYADSGAQTAGSPVPQPKRDSIQALREALEQRDAVIENRWCAWNSSSAS